MYASILFARPNEAAALQPAAGILRDRASHDAGLPEVVKGSPQGARDRGVAKCRGELGTAAGPHLERRRDAPVDRRRSPRLLPLGPRHP